MADKPDDMVTITVRRDEAETLSSDRCGCGHLYALHNFHCCDFCNVDGCPC